MKKLSFLLLIPLAACGARVTPVSAEPIVAPQPVAVAVTQPCVPEALTPPPIYVDSKEKLLAAQDAAERYQLVLGGRSQRIARLNELEPIIAGCPRGRSK